MHQYHQFQATFFPPGKTSSTTLFFFESFYGQPPCFCFFFLAIWDLIKSRHMERCKQPQPAVYWRGVFDRRRPSLDDARPAPKEWTQEVFFLPHDTATMKVHSIKKMAMEHMEHLQIEKKTLRNWKFDNNRFCWRVDGATPMYWRVMVSGGPEVNYLLKLGSFWE